MGAAGRALGQLAAGSLADVRVSEPPALPPRAARGVHAILRRQDPSCLERSLVLQRWLASQGELRAVVVGVSTPEDFRAHAWLEGEAVTGGPVFHEIARLAP
jgi:Transglutaminase-like superfamily